MLDGNEIAKVVKIKDSENLGITSTYELYALNDEKLVVATIATEYQPNRYDNTSYYYRLSFLTTNQTAIFSLSKFGPEKSFAKLIGESGIVTGNQLDAKKVTELIAFKGKDPVMAIPSVELYTMVKRSRTAFIRLTDDLEIKQDNIVIGKFKDVSTGYDVATYQFSIPEGLVIATISFSGRSKATEFIARALRGNNLVQHIRIPVGPERTILSSVDNNESTILRLSKWLIDNNYL